MNTATHHELMTLASLETQPIIVPLWINHPRQYGLKGIVTNNDLDGITSALVYSDFTGLPIVGIFDYETLHIKEGYEHIPPDRFVWLDADIVDPKYSSIGNHMTMLSPFDSTPRTNYNLSNQFFVFGNNPHTNKLRYTGSTLLMLHSVGQTNISVDDGYKLLLIPDGTFTNVVNYGQRASIHMWFDKMEINDLMAYMPKNNKQKMELTNLGKQLGWFSDDYRSKNKVEDGVFKTTMDIHRICELLGIEAHNPFNDAEYIPVKHYKRSAFNLDNHWGIMNDKADFIRAKNLPGLFSLAFGKCNEGWFTYEL